MKQFSELSINDLNRRKTTLKSTLTSFVILSVIIALILGYLHFFITKHISTSILIPLLVLLITSVTIFIAIKSIADKIELPKSKTINYLICLIV